MLDDAVRGVHAAGRLQHEGEDKRGGEEAEDELRETLPDLADAGETDLAFAVGTSPIPQLATGSRG